MARVHQLVLDLGANDAKVIAPEEWRETIPVAARVLADDRLREAHCYTGFALTAFPYKSLAPDQSYEKTGHNVTIVVDPTTIQVGRRRFKPGVPFGAYARLVMIYLQSEAVRNRSPVVSLGGSLHDFIENRLGLSWGGKTGRAVNEQVQRIAGASLKFFWTGDNGRPAFHATHIIRAGMFGNDEDTAQAALWDDHVRLDGEFYQHLLGHSVPLQDEAVRALATDAVALDAYVWLAYRLRELKEPTPVSWAALASQFGSYAEVRFFKRKFLPSLRQALAAYPGARVDIDERVGVTLHPSDPPVARRPRIVKA